MKSLVFSIIIVPFIAIIYLLFESLIDDNWLWVASLLLACLLVAVFDVIQIHHSLNRNYPLIGHFRYILEKIRPQIHQYFIESDMDGAPFSREQRSLAYERAKDVEDKKPFGTEIFVRQEGYEWLNHSIATAQQIDHSPRIQIGGPHCKQPYSASVLNISAMSFGALSANAIMALNQGAAVGGFAHDTGEGGLSPYHLSGGGDLIWEIGSGYFSCRDLEGHFDEQRFVKCASHPAVKMIEIKLSQGAKPGHGGVLPGAKVTAEIAKIRGITQGVDCISPSSHSAFNTPIELLTFIDRLRQLSDGKPVGFKLCVGHPVEVFGICKAIIATNIMPDFIVVDGKEGGTGAAPMEFSDHVGTPLRDGLLLVHNALTAIGVREHIKIGASGKIISAFDMAVIMAVGADWCNAARGFMFALGCLQSQRCHTNRCPVGVATQDLARQKALNIDDKSRRVKNFHYSTVKALTELVAAAGLNHASLLRPRHFSQRISLDQVRSLDQLYIFSKTGELLSDDPASQYTSVWRQASAEHFSGLNNAD